LSGDLERRIGRNEGLFRQVNEAIARGLWPEDAKRLIGFRCECARLDCNSPLRLTVTEYEHVRAHPRRFLLIPGHEALGAETIIESHPAYVVVEKHHQAGMVAEQMDPRG
jgi:hypothetical protein